MWRTKIGNINNIYALEGSLYSRQLELLEQSIVCGIRRRVSDNDFKTSKKPKPRDWIEHYFVHCIYGCMLYELTGISLKN